MGISHESILHSITEEFPKQVEESKLYAEIMPAVSEEYLYELCEGDEGLVELLEEMLEYFYRYTRDACEQQALIEQGLAENLESIQEKDGPRTALHNAMIDSVKILGRNLRKRGKDSDWLDKVDKAGRAGYAHLALTTTFRDILKFNSQS
jgi:hypothetical protein